VDVTAQTHLPGSRPGTVLVPQGALVRGPAFLIDTFLVSVFAALILGGQATLTKVVLVTLAAEFVYFSVSEGVFGTTLGKRLFGLRVVRAADGRPCGPLAAVVRTLLRLVDNILFSVPGITAIISSPRRQRLGDRAAKTLVVSEVPEQLVKVFGGVTGGGAVNPHEMARRLSELAQRQQAATGVPPVVVGPSGEVGPGIMAAEEALRVSVVDEVVPCPFCDTPMNESEIVCRHCDHYVNQVSAHGETDDMAPMPQLYAEDRNLRFDALWRLVFAGDEESLEAVRRAVPAWPQTDRLLAVHVFSEVVDPRPVAFLDFMAQDPDPAVSALAADVRRRLSA
jgi:uncharacterized RDD family membrane protein YckC